MIEFNHWDIYFKSAYNLVLRQIWWYFFYCE